MIHAPGTFRSARSCSSIPMSGSDERPICIVPSWSPLSVQARARGPVHQMVLRYSCAVAGLAPVSHVFSCRQRRSREMTGTRPAMTRGAVIRRAVGSVRVRQAAISDPGSGRQHRNAAAIRNGAVSRSPIGRRRSVAAGLLRRSRLDEHGAAFGRRARCAKNRLVRRRNGIFTGVTPAVGDIASSPARRYLTPDARAVGSQVVSWAFGMSIDFVRSRHSNPARIPVSPTGCWQDIILGSR